uniref:Calpain catalytic domain-containing protein n=1 Tax=Fusarium oxysporum (strain Fo5176) TaxID=660025 RepID=A0A0D2XSI3_FUSOF
MHGYSSSEESDDPRRPRAQPATTNNNDQKKKKKKKLPPQKSINRIWKKFSKRKFHKALAVLPFDPVQPPATYHSNELLSAGYERAAEECRRKVEKIIKECKRVNMRYRDPGWDLDWDLKYEKGHCLNHLGSQKFELNRTTLLRSQVAVPKAVKRVHEIFENPTFMKEVSGGDVKQGSLGDCWIMAGLTALANVPGGLQRICVAHNTKIGIYGFVFYRDGEWIYSIIDDKLYLKSPLWDSPSMQRDLLQQIDREDNENVYRKTYQTGSKALFFAQCRDQNETWVPLFEKAYAKAHGDYASLAGGWNGEGVEDLSGGVTTELLTSDILDVDEFWDKEMSRVNDEFLFGASTGLLEHGYGERNGISEGHAYVIMEARTLKSGQRLVKLRNPWGKVRKGIWDGAWSDGSKEWTTEVQEEMDHKFGSDSVFWISYEDLIRKYSHFDRTRLFRDRDWRCCQRWIGVDVAWKAAYHEKFHIKLTQDSPLVLVLSQLDGRYFKGLQGQYSFRLHFRLHYEDSPDAEDYIVRSHAAEECRRKVEKIIKECKRVNMRYRDPGWDLDWDLKYEKGHCLNHLGSQKFELNRTTLLRSQVAVPKAVKRVHEIFENPTFMKEVSGGDVKQGSLGDCWIMAGLTALANVPGGLQRICVAHNTKIGIYGFVFYRDGEWIYSIIDDKLYLKSPLWDSPSMQRDLLQQIDREDNENVYRKTYQTGSKALFFAQCRDQNETWVPLFEKAYAKAHGDYASLAGGWNGEGVEDLSGGVTTELLTSDILDVDEFWDKEMSRVNDEFLFGASTGLLEHGYGERNGISEGHAYVIMEARTLKSGQRLVKLRNPWGKVRKGIWDGAWSDGSKEWTTEVQEEMDHKFGSDSVFWISYEDLIRKYSHFDRTRLFRDRDWRCCQRWIGVDVAWKAAYHEKFHIKLTQDSPLVLVLSQLDGRYFKGLQGQYSFRLHFRLHYEDSPDAEDYIVRSHGNYLMERSVSVELPDIPAGNYVVYLKVTGERDSNGQSVEQVTKLRQKKDQKKASASRQKERRRMWEKRATIRDVTKQQTKKNADKRKRRRAEWEAEQNRLDEEFNAKVKAEREQMKKERIAKAEAEKAAEAEKRAQEADDEALSKKTEEVKISEDKDEPVVVDEHHKDHDDAVISVSTGSPHLTPKSMDSTAEGAEEKQEVPPVSGGPPAPIEEEEPLPTRPRPAYDSAGESSASPADDHERLFSSDDNSRDPRRMISKRSRVQSETDSDEEKMPEPWNAICIVGVRVYSKDENLELRTVMEGGELLEGGMGSKGAADLDNAQSNAGGGRSNCFRDKAGWHQGARDISGHQQGQQRH